MLRRTVPARRRIRDCLTFLTEPLFSMVDLALDRPFAALVAVAAFAVLAEATLLATH